MDELGDTFWGFTLEEGKWGVNGPNFYKSFGIKTGLKTFFGKGFKGGEILKIGEFRGHRVLKFWGPGKKLFRISPPHTL